MSSKDTIIISIPKGINNIRVINSSDTVDFTNEISKQKQEWSKNSAKDNTKIELQPDSTIFRMRNNTVNNPLEILENIKTKDKALFNIAMKLADDINSCFAGEMNNNIKLITKDNIYRVFKHYNLITDGTKITEDICDEWIKNKTKKNYIIHINNSFKARAEELNISTEELETEFNAALDDAFNGWIAWFGYISNSKIQKIDEVFEKYSKKILEKEVKIREELFHKPFTDEEVEAELNKRKDDWCFDINRGNEYYNKKLANDTLLAKGIAFTGKVEYPSKQQGGSCVLHASVNSAEQNEKGAHLVDRLFRLRGDTLTVCVPEAVRNNTNYHANHKQGSAKTYASESSFGDGDLAAFIETMSSYINSGDGNQFALAHKGFETLSGEKAQVFLPDEPIPKGVGITSGSIINQLHHLKRKNYSANLYNNLKEMLDSESGAAICSIDNHYGYFNVTKILGKYITDLKTETPTDKEVLTSSNHAYSIVKLSDEYAYLQESNNPTLFIKVKKEIFTNLVNEVATWKYD